MKNKELIGVYKALTGMNYVGVKFGYFVARNIKIIGDEIDAFQKSIEPSPSYNEYDTKRVEIAKKYAKKDMIGNPVIVNNKYEMEDQETSDKEFSILKEENEEVIGARTKQINEYEKLLDEECIAELYKIKQEYLPQDIQTQDIRIIFNLIEE